MANGEKAGEGADAEVADDELDDEVAVAARVFVAGADDAAEGDDEEEEKEADAGADGGQMYETNEERREDDEAGEVAEVEEVVEDEVSTADTGTTLSLAFSNGKGRAGFGAAVGMCTAYGSCWKRLC